MRSSSSRDPVAELLARLSIPRPDHAGFVGPPVDISSFTPLQLGKLWPAVLREHDNTGNPATSLLARSIVLQADQLKIAPALDEQTALEVFRLTSDGAIGAAVEHLACMICPAPEGLAQEARRILGDSSKWADQRYKAFVLARLTDADTIAKLRKKVFEKFADAPYVLQEFDVLSALSPNAALALASAKFAGYYWPGTDEAESDPAIALAGEAPYIEFAQKALAAARERIEDIHSGKVPYTADGAFTVEDSGVIGRAARVALLRDEPWLGDLITVLLPKVCVPPTSAKTAPSQSLAIALGHSVQGVPTPEGVQALREALSVVRHAGVKKKLARNLKPAERGLAGRPEVALRMLAESEPSKGLQTTLAACLEAGYWQDLEFTGESWCKQLAQTPVGKSLARTLVWTIQQDPAAPAQGFRLDDGKNSMSGVDAQGRPVRITPSSRVRLWHPSLADEAERDAWRTWVSSNQIRQPVRQAYREHYTAPAEEHSGHCTEMFAGYCLSVQPLIGLARRQGWQIDKFAGTVRTFGNVRATFSVHGSLYPGAAGSCNCERIHFEQRIASRWVPITLREIQPVVFSEICRAVDLLVSATTLAVEDYGERRPNRRFPDLTPIEMTRMRGQALKRAFAGQVAAGAISFDNRHIRVGDMAVHLSTARVTRNGDPVELSFPPDTPKLVAVPWLPYDEMLLQKIADSVSVLLGAESMTAPRQD
jgi:hypothetical protein